MTIRIDYIRAMQNKNTISHLFHSSSG